MSLIASQPLITARELSSRIGISERAVRKIIADLWEAGYIEIKKEGRRNRYIINHRQYLRHHMHQDVQIGDFLQALGWKKKPGKSPPQFMI